MMRALQSSLKLALILTLFTSYDDDFGDKPYQTANRLQLAKIAAGVFEPDDPMHNTNEIPPGPRRLRVDQRLAKSDITLFVYFNDQRYRVDCAQPWIDAHEDARLIASLARPVTSQEKAWLSCVDGFDITDCSQSEKILASVQDMPIMTLILRDLKLNNAGCGAISRLKGLKELLLYGVDLHGAMSIPRIVSLDLRSMEPDMVADMLSKNQQLKALILKEVYLSDRAVDAICAMTRTSELRIMSCNLNDKWLNRIMSLHGGTRSHRKAAAKSAQLEYAPLTLLSVHNTNVHDEGLQQLDQQTELTHLNLSRCEITDATMKRAAKLSKLQWLDICNTAISDEGIARLSSLKNLEVLSLRNTKVTAGCLHSLKEMRSLQMLSITGMEADISALKDLQKSLPGCLIR